MKNAFSTLGCPNWSFSDITTTAKDIGIKGIEIRGMGKQLYAPKLKIFDDNNIENTIKIMNNLGLEFSILTSGCDLSDEDFDATMNEAKDYIKLAKKLQCRYVRIMCESTPNQNKDIDIEKIASRYKKICNYAMNTGVKPLIETNSILAKSDNMLRFLNLVDMKNAFVLWDIHHPYRYYNEKPSYTFDKLKDYIKYVHIKDSIQQNEKTIYKMVGYGDVPIYECLELLYENRYDSWISLEWTLRWNEDLEDAGVVIPHYSGYIQALQQQIRVSNNH